MRDRRDAPSSRASAPAFSPGDVVLERYELREILGRGGMGIVFRAHDRILDQEIAIKIVRAEYAGDRVWAQRLAREVRLARQINHPNVCRVFDVGQADAHPFLTMELARRGTLRQEIAGERGGSVEQRVEDAKMIASGLAAIHRAGIVHRDLAPQNVLRMDDGSLVLSDFGLATDRVDGNSSVQGGTVAYMAPELVRGAPASIASDIWALGVVIHECVFGVRPAWSTTNEQLLRLTVRRPAAPVEAVVFQVCRACLSADPARRPKSAAEVAEWLARRRPRWRHRRAVRSLVLATVLLLFGAAALSAVARRRGSSSLLSPDGRSPLLVPTGHPEDWTDRSTVLAEVSDLIDCVRPLPDGKSIRFVWGRPRRADDVNLETGKRAPSPIVPDSYAEGCPDTTRTGRMVFPGYTVDGYPFAFVSEHGDGSAATPVVAIAQPSFLSDPVWFPDGDRFQYEIDSTHVATYSISTKQTTVLPGDSETFLTRFHGVVTGRSVLLPAAYDLTTELQLLSSPFVGADVKFRVPFFVTDVESSNGRVFLMTAGCCIPETPLVVADSVSKQARFVAAIPGMDVRHPVIVGGSLAFLAQSRTARLAIKGHPDVAISPELTVPSRCGRDIIAMRVEATKRSLWRLSEDGRAIEEVKVDSDPALPRCSPDGTVLYYISNQRELRRCRAGACSTIAEDVFSFTVSPDGKWIALFKIKNPPLGLVLLDADGTRARDVPVTNVNPCGSAWQTSDLLWVSVRKGRALVWEQLALPAATLTGRTTAGLSNCARGFDDPAMPFPPDVRIAYDFRSQVRVMRSLRGLDGLPSNGSRRESEAAR